MTTASELFRPEAVEAQRRRQAFGREPVPPPATSPWFRLAGPIAVGVVVVLCVAGAVWPVPEIESVVVVGVEPGEFAVFASPDATALDAGGEVTAHLMGRDVTLEVRARLGLLSPSEVSRRFGPDSRAAQQILVPAEVALARPVGGEGDGEELQGAVVRGRHRVGHRRVVELLADRWR